MNLHDITGPEFLKQLNIKELESLSREIRQFIIENISKTGGHFSSNLGVVELSVALHYVFDSPKDKMIFDVGHQSYIHKILTGRANQFNTLRQYNGLSGFQKRKESIHDQWEAGHSSTAISAGVGMAIARDLNHESGEIICIVGDGAIMSGESFEALNYLGSLKSKVIIILNDNDMSITENVGGLSNFFSEVRMSASYHNAKNSYVKFLSRNQFGKKIYQVTKKLKDKFKDRVLDTTIFSQFGLDYLGPVDGHDYHELINVLNLAKEADHSVVVHVHTIKGKGYEFAENDKKGIYHGVSPFNYVEGVKASDTSSWSSVISNHIEKHMDHDEDIVVITPAMMSGSCLNGIFDKYPQRSFDVGITEEHAMTFAAGLSNAGKKPYITMYSSFLQRAYDQINHDIARMNLPCLIGVDRAGLVGSDGETHHGVFDISFLSAIPNITIMTPSNAKEAKLLINTALKNFDHPYALRFPRGNVEDIDINISDTVEFGSWAKIIYDPSYLTTIITYDNKVETVKELIEKHNLKINLINARFIKPMDYSLLNELYNDKQSLVVYETDVMIGSLGSMIAHYYSKQNMHMHIQYFGIDDHFTPQGKVDELLKHENIDMDALFQYLKGSNNE